MKALKGWLLAGILLELCSFQNGQAQVIESSQLTSIPTRAVEPLQILVRSDIKDAFFAGEILSRRPLEAKTLEFTLLNEFNGVTWRETVKLPLQAQKIMPFYFEQIETTGRHFLSVQAYDQFGNTAGSGYKPLDFPEKIPSVTLSATEVFLDETPQLNVDLFVVNGLVQQSYVPQIKIYQGLEHFGDLVSTNDQKIITFDPRQRQQLSYKLPFSYSAGVYEIVITLLEANTRQPLSASYYQQIYRPGDFFKVVDLKTYYTATDKSSARIELEGLSTIVFTEPVQMQVRLQSQQNIYLDKRFSLTLQPGYFTKFIDLNLPDYVVDIAGSATFYLQGRKIQTIEFSSDKINLEELTDTAEAVVQKPSETIPPLIPIKKTFTLSDSQMWWIVVGCTMVLLLIVILAWGRSRWLVIFCLSLGGMGTLISEVLALTVGRGVFPMVEWSNPIPQGNMVFNPTSQTGFQWFPVKGRIFNYLTQTSLLKKEAFAEIRFNLISPTKRLYQFKLDSALLKPETEIYTNVNTGDYYFVLDLGLMAETNPIGREVPIVWEEGAWQLQLIFPYQQKDEDILYLATPLDGFGFFRIDQQPPLWQWQLKKSNGEILAEADFTNQPITVSISCQDRESECIKPIQDFNIVGNFCSDALQCNTEAARNFSVCDTAGNCATDMIEINGYDPVPPQIDRLMFGNLEVAIATEKTPLSLHYSDPNRVHKEDLMTPFNTQLCGADNPFFRLENQSWTCTERLQPCVLVSEHNVWRGQAYNGLCEPACPEGFAYENQSCQIICGIGAFTADRLCLPFNLKLDEM